MAKPSSPTGHSAAPPAAGPPESDTLEAELQRISKLGIDDLRSLWRTTFRTAPPPALPSGLLARAIAYRIQERQLGGLDRVTQDLLARLGRGQPAPVRRLKPGSVIVRVYRGTTHEVTVMKNGFAWRGTVHASLSAITRAITGTAWNGPRFFGLRGGTAERSPSNARTRPARIPIRRTARGSVQPTQTSSRDGEPAPRSGTAAEQRTASR